MEMEIRMDRERDKRMAIMIMVAENFQHKIQQMMTVKAVEKKTMTLITAYFIVIFAKKVVISLMIV